MSEHDNSVDTEAEQDPQLADESEPPIESAPSRPKKALPARKLSSAKQFEVLRAFAIAAGTDSKAVSIGDVAQILNIHVNSVSICNPFFNEVGLVEKQGHKFLPSAPVIAYANASRWNADTAGVKLRPAIEGSWFANALLPRLQMRPIAEDEAIAALAEASEASPEYRTQLVMLIDYLVLAGLAERENGTLKLASPSETGMNEHTKNPPAEQSGHERTPPPDPDAETFEIPIPGKSSAKVTVPKGLDAEDWKMVSTILDTYVNRLMAKNKTEGIE